MKLPNGERLWTSYYDSNGELLFVITSKHTRDFYFLYELVDGEFKRLGRAKSPLELEERFNVKDKMTA